MYPQIPSDSFAYGHGQAAGAQSLPFNGVPPVSCEVVSTAERRSQILPKVRTETPVMIQTLITTCSLAQKTEDLSHVS